MSAKDKALFLKFAYWAQNQKKVKVQDLRVEKYRTDLCIANTCCNASLLEMIGTRKALEHSVEKIVNSNNYTHITKEDCLRTLGSIYVFHHFKDGSLKYAPRDIKELISFEASAKDQRVAKPVILREEMRELLKYGNTMGKAIVCTLFDSGMRMGEFAQLRKSDLQFMEEGVDIKVPAGKTGERRIVVIEAKTYLARWLEEHPNKSADAPLWATLNGSRALGSQGIVDIIQLMAERMNTERKKKGVPPFSKPLNPHNFRHSRATELGGEAGMTEQILCKFFGWRIGSEMTRTYLHLTDEQVRRAVLAVHGKATNEPPKKIETHFLCRTCKAQNPLGANYCEMCGQPKDSDKQITRIGELEERMNEFMKKEAEDYLDEMEQDKLIDGKEKWQPRKKKGKM